MDAKAQKLLNTGDPALIGAEAVGPAMTTEAKTSKSPRRRARVRIGGVYIMGDRASAAQVRQAVATSADMLERLGQKITKPGVQLKPPRNVPLYFADPERPGGYLRRLNGRIERGVLEDGDFKVVD